MKETNQFELKKEVFAIIANQSRSYCKPLKDIFFRFYSVFANIFLQNISKFVFFYMKKK